jgi:hypothetical protein
MTFLVSIVRRRSHHPDGPLTRGAASPTLTSMPGEVLTKRRAVDLCRTTTCLCRTA